MCVSRSSQDKKLVSPVFAAHMLSSGLPLDLRSDYGGHPLPVGEQPATVLYEHLQFYVDKRTRGGLEEHRGVGPKLAACDLKTGRFK